MTNRFAKTVKELPTDSRYMILTERSTYIEGDERSRLNPGHGYPAYTEQSWDVEIFENVDMLIRDIEQREKSSYSRTNYMVFEVKPVKITKKVSIDVTT